MSAQIIYLSEHFSLKEATDSAKARELGIDNSQVSPEVIAAAQRTATGMEKVRVVLGNVGIKVNSWIRSLALNAAVSKVVPPSKSQHVTGQAVDFTCAAFGTPLEICKKIIENKDLIRFDQLILEHTWVHISFASPNVQPRGQVLSLLEGGKYAVGLTDIKGTPYAS